MANRAPLAYRYGLVESTKMSNARPFPTSRRICPVRFGAVGLAAAMLLLSACNDFSPEVGKLQSQSACTDSVSAPTPSHPYGVTVVTCPDGGDAGNTNAVNVVEAGDGGTTGDL